MTTLQTQIPDQLPQQAQYLVDQGLVTNIDELIVGAIHPYLEPHREAMIEQCIPEDVEWGLHGAG